MANISPQMVKELREKTGAGMMDCKAALVETSGNSEAAVDWLRKKGLAKAAKKASRIAADGLVAIALAPTHGVVVEVNSETDFVARNDHFQGLVKMIAQAALKTGTNLEAIKAAHAGSQTIGEAIASAIATIGENMTLRRAASLSVEHGRVASYVHSPITGDSAKSGGWARWSRPGTGMNWPNWAANWPCMSPPPIRRRSMQRVLILRS